MGRKFKNIRGGAIDDVQYDDSAFELFLCAFIAAVWIPIALVRCGRFIARAWAPPPSQLEKARDERCVCRSRYGEKKKDEHRDGPSFGIRTSDLVFVVAGAALVFLTWRAYTANSKVEPPFDPFAILGVPETASKREISKAYRKLAVVHHPDKNRDNPNAGEEFIRISKAFSALTDEAAAENYKKYGNPDGYVGTTLGIGLPSWVEQNSSALLVVYVVLLLGFPVVVGLWWRRQVRLMPTSVTTDTFMLYRETICRTQRFRDVIGALAGSIELADVTAMLTREDLEELSVGLKRGGKEDMKRVKFVTEPKPHQLHNMLLLNAYLSRIDVPDRVQTALRSMLDRMPPLLTALTDTVGAFQRPDCQAAWPNHFMHGHSTYLFTCLNISQCLLQGVDKGDSPLLQIPGFSEKEVRYCMSSRTTPAKTVYEFARLEMKDQRDLLRAFSDDEFRDVRTFCDRYPVAMIDLKDPVVEGEVDQTVHAKDTVTVRARLTVMRKAGSVYSPCVPNLESRKPEVWWVALSDQRLMCPIEVKRLLPRDAVGHDPEGQKRKPRGDACCGGLDGAEPSDTDAKDADKLLELASDPRVTIYDLKFEFTAPREGTYNLELMAAVDCYIGCNRSKTVRMDVAPAVDAEASPEVRYFDTDDESDYDPDASTDEDEDEDGDNAKDSDSDTSYEYIEVTASESGDDLDDLDDLNVNDKDKPSAPNAAPARS